MKRGETVRGVITTVDFPNRGVMTVENKKVYVKGVIAGQMVDARITKNREDNAKAELVGVVEPSSIETMELQCKNFGVCGGCFYQPVPYEEELKIKEGLIRKLLLPFLGEEPDAVFEGITGSPEVFGYRNKMEFSFGDEVKDGPLTLGLHKKKSKYDILDVGDCALMDADFQAIQQYTARYFQESGLPFYKKISHEGYLRYLVLRKGKKTNQIMVDLVTSTQAAPDLTPWADGLRALELDGTVTGILNTVTDSFADTVKDEGTTVLFGEPIFEERLFDLSFEVSMFSFFQTNTSGAEVLYSKVIDFLGDCKDRTVFDLYSGTGTIAQILASAASKVVGVEIVEEAVDAARRNAKRNGLENCEFIAGDVLKVVEELTDKPDLIVLDPPREGIHPKAIGKIIDFGVDRIVYVSCKPTSLAEDLVAFTEAGYVVERACCVDMFPRTLHVESVVLLSRTK